ncbi:unannotated protein [freshwater metagenome]|uniref:Unannotated protein n=1 Tax=freshwater metagenome TaxID=449393 RepID=A0A6J7GSY3_9ZZZZ
MDGGCAVRHEGPGDLHGVVVGVAVGQPVVRGDAHGHRHPARDDLADGVEDLQREAQPVRQAPAVGVGALVGGRGQERRQQVAVRGVHLDQVEPGVDRPAGRGGEVGDRGVQVGAGGFAGHVAARAVGQRAGPDDLPVAGLQRLVDALPHELGGALAPRVPDLDADLGRRPLVHEPGHPGPGVALLVGPQPGAAQGDPGLRGHAGHLGHHQAGAAQGLAAQVHQVELTGHALLGDVHVHGRQHDPVGQLQPADPDRLEHGRGGLAVPVPGGEGGLDLGGEHGVPVAQVLEGDPAGPGQQVEHELGRLLVRVHADPLEPLQRGLGRALGGLDHRLALVLVGGQSLLDRGVLVQAGGQRQRVLHGELGARADGEVRGVRRVAQQHQVALVPALVADGLEVQPLRVVGEHLVPGQLVGEDLPDPLDGVGVAHPGRELLALGGAEARALPDVVVHLDDEGRPGVGERVAVDLHRPPLRVLDDELEGLEDQVGAQPDVLVVPTVQRGAERLGVRRPDLGVQPVAGHHQVVGGAQLLDVGGQRAVVHGDAELGDPLLQDRQQLLAAHGGEALAAHGEGLPVDLDVDVGPPGEAGLHPLVHDLVGALDAAQRLVGEHDAEAERVVGGVALPDGDLVAAVQLAQQRGQVQATGPAADDRDLHDCSPVCGTAARIRPSWTTVARWTPSVS